MFTLVYLPKVVVNDVLRSSVDAHNEGFYSIIMVIFALWIHGLGYVVHVIEHHLNLFAHGHKYDSRVWNTLSEITRYITWSKEIFFHKCTFVDQR